jgi:CBS domain-containing protein
MGSPLWNGADSYVTRPPVYVAPDASLREVTAVLWANEIGILLVGDARHLLGVISERDVVATMAHGGDPDAITAESVMTRNVVSVRPRDPIYDAAIQMLDDGFRHVPLVDEYGEVTGVVSVRDLLRPLLVTSLEGKHGHDTVMPMAFGWGMLPPCDFRLPDPGPLLPPR